MSHDRLNDLLPLYAAGQLDAARREEVDAHVAACAGCRADLELWTVAAHEIRTSNLKIAAPARLAERALAGAPEDRSLMAGVRRIVTLVLAQRALVRRQLFPASALLMLLGVSIAIAFQRPGVFYFFAPMIAAGGLALIYGRESDPAAELTLATPTPAWKILLARMVLVSSYDVVLALAASAALYTMLPAGMLTAIVASWLAPLAFLSAFALMLSLWTGTGTALLIAYTAWIVQWMPYFSDGGIFDAYRGFWSSPMALFATGVLLVAASLWSAERVARPGVEAA